MLTIIIPTLNAEKALPGTLLPLISGAVFGLVSQVVVSDGGSSDLTRRIADDAGCDWVEGPQGRGIQLSTGAGVARGEWLLFLHGDTRLSEGWIGEIEAHISREQNRGERPRAAYFRFALDDHGIAVGLLEKIVHLRCLLLALPYGDQGLLISKQTYDALGGYKPLPLMEDVDLIRRIGRRHLVPLKTEAVTSAVRYRKNGFLARIIRNVFCLTLYFLGVSPHRIKRLYES